jgi:hypothetical protein
MRLQLLVLLALACVLAFAASASAHSSGATVQHFTFTDPGGGGTCNGNRITHTGTNPFIKDVETCIVTFAFLQPGTYDLTDMVWCSDFDGAPCNRATSGRLTVTDNGDGTFTWDVVAYYAQP